MKGKIEQAWANRLKILRTAIRLKYSLLADEELNIRRDQEYKKFYKAVQDGKVLPPLDPKKALSENTDT